MNSSPQFRACGEHDLAPADLKPYDGLRIVVLMPVDGRQIPFLGKAHYERHPTLGVILRIQADPEELACPEVILSQQLWRGVIERDTSGKADYRFLPASHPPKRC